MQELIKREKSLDYKEVNTLEMNSIATNRELLINYGLWEDYGWICSNVIRAVAKKCSKQTSEVVFFGIDFSKYNKDQIVSLKIALKVLGIEEFVYYGKSGSDVESLVNLVENGFSIEGSKEFEEDFCLDSYYIRKGLLIKMVVKYE